MMELEIGFDDDLFSEEKDKSLKEQHVWSPKLCEPECLLVEKPISDDHASGTTEHAQMLSYQGDFLYSKKQFALALATYRKGVGMVPVRYVLLRRIFIEGAARCCIKLLEHDRALHMATMLLEESLTLEHRMTAYSLLAAVHTAAGNQQEAIRSLHICIQWQRSNAHFWLKLAEAYSALYQKSHHAPYTNQTGHESGRTGHSELSNSRSSEGGYHGDNCIITFENRACKKSCVNHCAHKVDTFQSKVSSSGVRPQKEPSVNIAVENSPNTCRNQPERDHSGRPNQKSDSSCPGDICPTTLKSKSVPVPNTVVEISEPNDRTKLEEVCSTEDQTPRERDVLAVRDLLNKLDDLVISDQNTNIELCSDKTKAELICKECRPILCAASCLLRTRLLLKSVEHSVRSFAKVKNSQQRNQIDQSLADIHLDPAVVEVLHHHARRIFRRGCHRLDEEASVTDEGGGGGDKERDARGGENKLSAEGFEQRWFPWGLA